MDMHPGIKLRHLRAFTAIAAAGSLTRVARAEGITQPALSRTLADLEAMLSRPLFLRQGRRLILTEAGRLFLRHAEAGLAALEAGARALAPGRAPGRLRIGVLPTVAETLLPAAALRFAALAPEITLAVVTGPHYELLRQIRETRMELLVGRMPAASELADLRFDHLYDDRILAVARAGHPLAGRPAREALARHPAILPPRGALIRQPVETWLAAQGLGDLRPMVETVSLALGRGLLLASDAVWFISEGVVAREIARGDLIELPTESAGLTGAVGMTRLQAAPPSPALELLVAALREARAGRAPPSE